MSDAPVTTQSQNREGWGRWVPAVFVLVLIGVYFVAQRQVEPPPEWGHDFEKAMASAAKEDRPVVAAFYSEGCPPCAAMDRSVLRDEKVREELTDFVPVRVNMWREREIANRMGVMGTPTFLVVSATGQVRARCEGFQPVDDFIRFLHDGREPAPDAGGDADGP